MTFFFKDQLDLWKFSVWTGAIALFFVSTTVLNLRLPFCPYISYLVTFFLGPLEKKFHQNLGSQSAPVCELVDDFFNSAYRSFETWLFLQDWIVNPMVNLLKRTMTYPGFNPGTFGLAVSIPNHYTI
jgi:hypothetical protein